MDRDAFIEMFKERYELSDEATKIALMKMNMDINFDNLSMIKLDERKKEMDKRAYSDDRRQEIEDAYKYLSYAIRDRIARQSIDSQLRGETKPPQRRKQEIEDAIKYFNNNNDDGQR